MSARLHFLPATCSQWMVGQSLHAAMIQIYKLFLAGAIDEAELARLDGELRARQAPLAPPVRPLPTSLA